MGPAIYQPGVNYILEVEMDRAIEDGTRFDQLLAYFAGFVREVSAIATQVKALAYVLINVPQPSAKAIAITQDISSVMNACKRTHDDLKRTESILRGHVKGKESDESPSSSRILPSSSRKLPISASKYPHLNLQLNLPLDRAASKYSPAKQIIENAESSPRYPAHQTTQIHQSTVEEAKSMLANPPSAPGQGYISQPPPSYRSEPYQSRRPRDISVKLQTMRASQKHTLKGLVLQNDECISLIHRIRDQLKIKIK